MTVLPVAHRAPRDPARCARLVAAGARMFELDVQLRGTGVVVSHYLPLWVLPLQRDNWRFRLAPGRDRTLRDALAALPPQVDVLLDPKHHTGFVAEHLVDAIAEHLVGSGQPERFVVSTGCPALLAAYRRLGVRTWRSVGDRVALRRLLAGGPIAEEGVSVRHTLLDAESVAALHGITGTIAAWTVNRVRRARRLAALGVDAITTDRVRVLTALDQAAGPGGGR